MFLAYYGEDRPMRPSVTLEALHAAATVAARGCVALAADRDVRRGLPEREGRGSSFSKLIDEMPTRTRRCSRRAVGSTSAPRRLSERRAVQLHGADRRVDLRHRQRRERHRRRGGPSHARPAAGQRRRPSTARPRKIAAIIAGVAASSRRCGSRCCSRAESPAMDVPVVNSAAALLHLGFSPPSSAHSPCSSVPAPGGSVSAGGLQRCAVVAAIGYVMPASSAGSSRYEGSRPSSNTTDMTRCARGSLSPPS